MEVDELKISYTGNLEYIYTRYFFCPSGGFYGNIRLGQKKFRVFGLVLCSLHRQSLISPSLKGRAASHPQSCSAVPNSATAPMDSSKEKALYDAV